MSKKPESESPILTRRQFGVASVTAGLGLLLGTNDLFAQQQQQQQTQQPTAPPQFEPEPRRIIDEGPMLEPLQLAKLTLVSKVDIDEKRLRLNVYALNESEHELVLEHTSNGVARHIANISVKVGDKTFALVGRPDGWQRAHMSRAIRPGFKSIAPANKGQATRFHLGEFDAAWSKEMIAQAKKLAGKAATLEFEMNLRVVNARKTSVKPPEAVKLTLPKKMIAPS